MLVPDGARLAAGEVGVRVGHAYLPHVAGLRGPLVLLTGWNVVKFVARRLLLLILLLYDLDAVDIGRELLWMGDLTHPMVWILTWHCCAVRSLVVLVHRRHGAGVRNALLGKPLGNFLLFCFKSRDFIGLDLPYLLIDDLRGLLLVRVHLFGRWLLIG